MTVMQVARLSVLTSFITATLQQSEGWCKQGYCVDGTMPFRAGLDSKREGALCCREAVLYMGE